jgi:hypothetical protein
MLMNGRNFDDIGTVIEDLGFSLVLTNARPQGESAGIHLHCGAYPGVSGLPVPNNCLIHLPQKGQDADRILQVEKLRQIFSVVVRCWEPDWGRLSSGPLFDLVPVEEGQPHMVGSMTYFSKRYGELPWLPEQFEVWPVGGFGTLIILKTKERYSTRNPEQGEALRNLTAILKCAGKLIATPGLMTK